MKDHTPLVSIIIPIYNGSNYMIEAIDSALAQTYSNIEVIVVNDGSTDNTEEIALSYGDKIRYFKKENGGVSSALNLGIKEMRGDYFSWLSHDDVYYPEKIFAQISALKSIPNKKCLVLCNSEHIDKNSKLLPQKLHGHYSTEDSFMLRNDVLHNLLQNGSFNGCALLIPKDAFDQCGLFDETLRFNQDGFMWAKIFLAGYSLYHIQTIGVQNRVHEGQVTQKRQDLFHKDCQVMSEYLIPELMRITTPQDRFLFDYAKYNGKHNNRNIIIQIRKQATYKQFSLHERMIVTIYSVYGKIRPFIRRMYYLIFRKIKTE